MGPFLSAHADDRKSPDIIIRPFPFLRYAVANNPISIGNLEKSLVGCFAGLVRSCGF